MIVDLAYTSLQYRMAYHHGPTVGGSASDSASKMFVDG